MNYAVIVAGGRGTRMGSETPKQFIEISGRHMLYYSIRAMEESNIDGIIIVAGQGTDPESMKSYEMTKKIVTDYDFKKVIKVVIGGAQRYDSCYAGIAATPANLTDIILIHDAARPCVTP